MCALRSSAPGQWRRRTPHHATALTDSHAFNYLHSVLEKRTIMYSLYRAWLMRDAVAASLATPADVVVNVGGAGAASRPQQFAAHRAVLAAHSGYLKALLAAAPEAVTVPSVGGDAFAPLLTFMYTGFLDLTAENIYSVLLATHLLHMPRALDLCRAYLQQAPPPPPPPPPLVKPIPSRKLPPHALLGLPPAPTSTSFWPAPPPLLLPTAHASPFRCVMPSTSHAEDPHLQPPASPLAGPSTTTKRSSPSPAPSSLSPCLSASSRSSSADDRHVMSSPPPAPPQRKAKPPSLQRKADDASSGKVIIDVACCDGPVRFHRVLNDNYGLVPDDTKTPPPDPKTPPPSSMAPAVILERNEPACGNGRGSREAAVSSSSSGSSSGIGNVAGVGGGGGCEPGGDGVYTCVYCNHTFKSHYCYQKHARRHINPVTSLQIAKKQRQATATVVPRREVRLLDMNVQYYPCKTCGCKFPSYYFVHKHRKLCHATEDSDSAVGGSDESRSQTAVASV